MSVLMKAIVEKCMDCCCGDKKEVKECEIAKCSLHQFRLGKNPTRKKREVTLTDEQRLELKDRMAKARELKGK